MDFKVFGKEGAPSLLLIPGLGVSYEIFLPLIGLLEERFRIIAVQVDGFTLGTFTRFTSIDDQAAQVIAHVKASQGGRLDCAYGLSLGGKILSHPCCPFPGGWKARSATTSAPTCGHATTGRDSGGGYSIRTTSMSCWTNVGKCIPSGAARPFLTGINRSIPISWSQYPAPISTSGTGRSKLSWPGPRQSICKRSVRRPASKSSRR